MPIHIYNWVKVGRTEFIWNNYNPDFVKKFIIDYHFQKSQSLMFEM